MYLFLSGTDQGILNLDVMLEALKNKIQVFTEKDLFSILKDFAEETTVVKYNDEFFQKFIDKYK